MAGLIQDEKFANIFIDSSKEKAIQLVPFLDDFIEDTYNGKEPSNVKYGYGEGQKYRCFHPSKLARAVCARKLALEYAEAEPNEGAVDNPAKTYRIWHNGHDVHDRLQEYMSHMHVYTKGKVSLIGRWRCKDCGERYGYSHPNTPMEKAMQRWIVRPVKCSKCGSEFLKYQEIGLGIDEWNVRGKADGVILYDGEKYIWEIKSMNSFGWTKLDGPPDYYIPQPNFYMKATGIHKTIWWFEDKNTQGIKEYLTHYDYSVIDPLVGLLSEAKKYIDNGKFPPPLQGARDIRAHCKKCEYRIICGLAGDKLSFDLSIADCA